MHSTSKNDALKSSSYDKKTCESSGVETKLFGYLSTPSFKCSVNGEAVHFIYKTFTFFVCLYENQKKKIRVNFLDDFRWDMLQDAPTTTYIHMLLN